VKVNLAVRGGALEHDRDLRRLERAGDRDDAQIAAMIIVRRLVELSS